MQIIIKGEMSLSALRQTLFEQLGSLEDDFAIIHSKGATLYVHPTDGEGAPVVARRNGKVIDIIRTSGPYCCAADKALP